MTVGKIVETFRSKFIITFEWRVPRISFLRNTVPPYYYHSPQIIILDTGWNFKLFEPEKDLIGLHVSRNVAAKPVILSVVIKWSDGSEQTLQDSLNFRKSVATLSLGKFRRRCDLLRRIAGTHLDTITISCTVHVDTASLEEGRLASRETQTEELWTDREVDTKDVATLQKHLQDLLLTGDDHDVTIKIGNQEFRAHKSMLRARSSVFSAMFKHKMKESTDGSISIEDCDPDGFGEFLKYVYTGKVAELSPSKAMSLYYAADKYDVSGLKEKCIKFLKTSLSSTVICDVIALATDHGEKELLECATNFFSVNTKEILTTVEWQRFAKNNFIVANELYIKSFESLEKKVNG